MKKSTNLIYYLTGCYGTFAEWSCDFFSVDSTVEDLPFTTTGSSHKFGGNFLFPSQRIFEYIESNSDLNFARCHPGVFVDAESSKNVNESRYTLFCTDLTFLTQHFEKIMVLYPTETTKLAFQNNCAEKCLITDERFQKDFLPYNYTKESVALYMTPDVVRRYKMMIAEELDLSNISQWGKASIDDFDIWELRELLSLYWFNRQNDLYYCWDQLTKEFPGVQFVPIDNLKLDFNNTVMDYLNYFKVDLDHDRLKQLPSIQQQWRSVQHNLNSDDLVNQIVDSLRQRQEFEWTPLPLLSEAYLQHKLRENNIEIQCWNLNSFPTTTQGFLPLLKYI